MKGDLIGDDKGKSQHISSGVCFDVHQVDKCSTVDQIYGQTVARHYYSAMQQQHIFCTYISEDEQFLKALQPSASSQHQICLHWALTVSQK